MKSIHFLVLLLILLSQSSFTQAQQSVEVVKPTKGFNYVILDAASWGFQIEIAQEENTSFLSLFNLQGEDQDLESVAPYLFALDGSTGNDSFANWLIRKYDKTHRALYLYADCSLEELRNHLSAFVRVKRENGETIFFRFYDPAIVPYMFSELTTKQAAAFFAKVEYIGFIDIKTEEETSLGLTEEARRYAKENKLTSDLPLTFSNKQMNAISEAMGRYNALELPAAKARLEGRQVEGSLPLPVISEARDSRVNVEITVNRKGKVMKVKTISQGSDLLGFKERQAAEAAALKTQFTPNDTAPENQVGNIIYHISRNKD